MRIIRGIYPQIYQTMKYLSLLLSILLLTVCCKTTQTGLWKKNKTPPECMGLEAHIQQYWKYKGKDSVTVYELPTDSVPFYTQYRDCFLRHFDTTRIFALMGRPYFKTNDEMRFFVHNPYHITQYRRDRKIGMTHNLMLNFDAQGKITDIYSSGPIRYD